MNNQTKLYRFGYRPWYRTLPHEPQWRRLPNCDDFTYNWGGDKSEEGTGFIIRWRHRLHRDGSTTYFAFCPPFGHSECQQLLDSVGTEFPTHVEGAGVPE